MNWNTILTIMLPLVFLIHKQYHRGRINYRECNITFAMIICTQYYGVFITLIIHMLTLLYMNYNNILIGINILRNLYDYIQEIKHNFMQRRPE
jgi:hypothetical protein